MIFHATYLPLVPLLCLVVHLVENLLHDLHVQGNLLLILPAQAPNLQTQRLVQEILGLLLILKLLKPSTLLF